MVQNSRVPGDAEELEQLLHPTFRVQDKLFIVDHHTTIHACHQALVVHDLHGTIPLGQTVPVTVQVKTSNCDLPGDHGVDGRPTVSHHQDELGVGEEFGEIN